MNLWLNKWHILYQSLLSFYGLFFIRLRKYNLFHTAKKCEAYLNNIYVLTPLFLTKMPATISFLWEFIPCHLSLLSLPCIVAKSPLLDYIFYFERCLSSNHYSLSITFQWYLLNHNHFSMLVFLEHFVS